MKGAGALLPEMKSHRASPDFRGKSFIQNEGGVWGIQETENEGLAGQEEATITFRLSPSGQPCNVLGIRTLSGQSQVLQRLRLEGAS